MTLPEQVQPDDASAGIAAFGPSRFFNRELSWLHFNRRVLEEAENERHPLLERLRFLSISASNLDEFYMVRVAGLRGQVVAGIETPSEDGLTPAEQLDRINRFVAELTDEQQETWVQARSAARRCRHPCASGRAADRHRAHLARGSFPQPHLPGAHADRGRSGASFPLHPQFRLHARARARARGIVAHHARAHADPLAAQPLHPAACSAKVATARSDSSGSRPWSASSCRACSPAIG